MWSEKASDCPNEYLRERSLRKGFSPNFQVGIKIAENITKKK
jgi:hypothetical protein